MRTSKWLLLQWLLVTGLITPVGARDDPPPVLRVPYLAQSELLCGGAAVAMVERWWGRRGVYAEDFTSLIRKSEGGIRTSDLLLATQGRGWKAVPVRGTAELITQLLRDSIPVIALIRVADARYHYVVIVGWSESVVVFHDPAVAPFKTLKVAEFLKRWQGTDQWAMVVQPTAFVARKSAQATVALTVDSMPCRPWLDEAVDATNANRLDDAERLLKNAGAACPSEPTILRELAGVRLRQRRYDDATRLVREYLGRSPDDSLAWQLLATSRYLAGDPISALAAWNKVGRPRVDLVAFAGIRRTRFKVFADAIAKPFGTTLTTGQFALARRRLADLPVVSQSRVSYLALPGGSIELQAVVVERPLVDPLVRLAATGLVSALGRRAIGVTLNSPLGVGEQWNTEWRWERANPGQLIHLGLPGRLVIPGVFSVVGSSEHYRFADAIPEQERWTTSVGFQGWLRGNLEGGANARYEQWGTSGNVLALSLGGGLHSSSDRLAVTFTSEIAVPLRARLAYTRLASRAAWISSPTSRGMNWSARFGADWVSDQAPRGLWPIAGGNLGRDIPLRAHPFAVEGLLSAERGGRTVLHGGVAGDHHVASIGQMEIGAGVYVDGADVMNSAHGTVEHRRYLDAGAGVRLGLTGMSNGSIRFDVARGLATDRRWTLMVGLERAWPLRLRALR